MPTIQNRFGRNEDGGSPDALQAALDTFDGLIGQGVEHLEAIRRAGQPLDGPTRRAFSLAVALQDAAGPVPALSEGFADKLEARLRAAAASPDDLPQPDPRDDPAYRPSGGGSVIDFTARRGRIVRGVAGLAACLVLLAGVGQGAIRSLPGDRLYGIKEAGRSARVAVASGRSEALLRVSLAGDRFAEVDRLIDRSQGRVIGSPGATVATASSDGIRDPRLRRLIAETIRRAHQDLAQAALVLLTRPDRFGLQRLESVARQGQQTVAEVEPELPEADKPPVAQTKVSLEAIQFQAAVTLDAIDDVEPEPTIGPCDSPTPSPSPTPTPSPTVSPSPTAKPTATPQPTRTPIATLTPAPTRSPSPSPSPTPSPTPVPTPSPTPCVSPTPSPSPVPTASPTPEPTTAPAARTTPRPSPAATPVATPAPTPTPRATPSPSTAPGEPTAPESQAASRSCHVVLRVLRLCG